MLIEKCHKSCLVTVAESAFYPRYKGFIHNLLREKSSTALNTDATSAIQTTESYSKTNSQQTSTPVHQDTTPCVKIYVSPASGSGQKSVPKGMETTNWKEREPSLQHRLSTLSTCTLPISILYVKISPINAY